jgi:hypothetical protein
MELVRNNVTLTTSAKTIKRSKEKAGTEYQTILINEENFDNVIAYLGKDVAAGWLQQRINLTAQAALDEATDEQTKEVDEKKFIDFMQQLSATSESIGELTERREECFAEVVAINEKLQAIGDPTSSEFRDLFAKFAKTNDEIRRIGNAIESKRRKGKGEDGSVANGSGSLATAAQAA